MSPRLDASAIFAIFNCLRIRVSPQCGTLLELPQESRRFIMSKYGLTPTITHTL